MPYQHRNVTVYNFGERGSGLRPRGSGKVQDFAKLHQQHFESGQLFEDDTFPASDESIFYSRSPPRSFQWRRPTELVEDPHLFVEGASRFDVKQGELGDCWLLASVANLTLNQKLFERVVPHDQGFNKEYAGIFHFRFWQYGRWVDVVIDDRLPTVNNRLVFMHSKDNDEFWSALLEKAYAKLHGSYEALKGGSIAEAMEDFTGGVTESYELNKPPNNLFKILLKGYERESLIGCGIDPDPNIYESVLPNGLVKGHAYSITAVKMPEIKTPRMSGKIPLLRIRNPWGNEHEWKGAWSDKSAEWRFISQDQRDDLGIIFAADGEFWISFADFLKNFNKVEICNLQPDSLEEDVTLDEIPKKTWETMMFEGSWVRGVTAGGCRNYLETFACNPQYCVTLEDVDEDDDDDKCTIIVALMQKNRRSKRNMGVGCLSIGFAIYHLEDPNSLPKPLNTEYFRYTLSVARSETYINKREVAGRFKLPPGTYCIVPSTFDPNEEGEFVLRTFSEKRSDVQELDDKVGIKDADTEVQVEINDDQQDSIRRSFKKIAGDDMEVNGQELKAVLDHVLKKEFDFEGFGKNVCRGMVAMMDADHSGKLGFEEFMDLWKDIYTWKNVFKKYDRDSCGSLSTFELRAALVSAGYHLNWRVLKALALRYGDDNGKIRFEDFISCAVKLKSMIEVYKDKDITRSNRATFSLDEWVESTMYA